MMPVILLLLAPAAWGPQGCLPVGGRLFGRPAFSRPLFAPQPAPVVTPDDAEAVGRGGCCSPLCTCGCNAGRECVCGNAKPEAAFGDTDFPTGVDFGKLSKSPRYTINGREVTRAEAVVSVQQVVDDSKRPRLTLIGPEAERKALRAAVLADAGVAALVLAQDYAPDSPFVLKHDKEGLTVHLQKNTHDGTPLMPPLKGLKASDAADVLQKIKEALGLAPKKPEPKKPDPKKPGPDVPGPSLPGGIPPLAWLGVALLGLWMVLDRAFPKREGVR